MPSKAYTYPTTRLFGRMSSTFISIYNRPVLRPEAVGVHACACLRMVPSHPVSMVYPPPPPPSSFFPSVPSQKNGFPIRNIETIADPC